MKKGDNTLWLAPSTAAEFCTDLRRDDEDSLQILAAPSWWISDMKKIMQDQEQNGCINMRTEEMTRLPSNPSRTTSSRVESMCRGLYWLNWQFRGNGFRGEVRHHVRRREGSYGAVQWEKTEKEPRFSIGRG